MKKEFLTELLPDADAAVIDQIMAEYEKSVEAQKKCRCYNTPKNS